MVVKLGRYVRVVFHPSGIVDTYNCLGSDQVSDPKRQ